MSTPKTVLDEKREETLDPESPEAWDALRALGRRMVDDAMDSLRTVRERPVWRPLPPSASLSLNPRRPVPQEGEGAEAVYRDFVENVRPYPTGNIHPRFWGWVMGTGTPLGMLAEMLAAGMNCHVAGYEDAAARVEDQVLAWCRELLGFPEDASGLLVSGASMATLVGLSVARSEKAGGDVRRTGLFGQTRMTLYASRETHACVRRAAEVLGLGSDSLRLLPVDADFRVDVGALRAAIARDRAEGLRPFCVVGNAGTVNTGAVDDLEALADVAEQEGLWFHVDGAFGALAALSPRLRPLLRGMERADSLAFDLHKWMHIPFEAGCVLVRSEAAHRRAFAYQTEYLAQMPRGLAARPSMFSEYGVQLTRGFRALKVWMSLKAHGAAKFARLIEQNVEQAHALARWVDAEPELQRLAPVSLNVVCFRYVGRGVPEERLDAWNRELLCRLHESGVAVPSYTTLGGRYCLRVCLTNHRTRREDLEFLVHEVLRLGRELAAELEAKSV
ncbi:aspartate aminotransferase family protein [Archangium violaceum]|uniref:pyridoxal phosphate-dependent decarboxylase family protein n=1 Tax=Archangium violaceum TaxID=83451 RepID=UPI002B2C4A28|nr:aspartate aminotransferase family protein [Archangium gephyra]